MDSLMSDKFQELILYIAKECETDTYFGATKLNKILFYSDFLSFRETGQSISGAEYMRLDNGPVPRNLVPVRDQLISQDDLVIVYRDCLGRTQKRPVTRREPDISLFSALEIKTVDRVISKLWNKSATETSELSHKFIGWKVVENRETIPYKTAYINKSYAKEFQPKNTTIESLEKRATEFLSRG